ncbi:MAG TPA: GAF domain-containing protein [Rhizobacter sp.]|nr:GAF domain-containing protein [Rhizobacter sp.]
MDSSRSTLSSLAATVRPYEIAQGPGHLQAIEQSHQRCRAMGLTEAAIPELSPISAHGARQVREQHQRLFEHATPVMEMLCEQILFTKSIVALADAQGNTLQVIGDNGFLERVQQIALSPGVNWAESTKGTNAVGTALFTEAPTLVHAQEHFLAANRFLTCSASPIFDHTGQMMGVLDVSGHQLSYHPHTLAMVTMAARRIENHWFSDQVRHGLRLHFHPRREMLGTMREAMIALAPDGAILGANRSALEHLGLNMPALRNLGLETVFGISVASIADHCRHRADEPMHLHAQQGEAIGQPMHGRALFNWPTFWPAVSLSTGVGLPPEPATAVQPTAPEPAVAAPSEARTGQTTLQAQEMAAIRQAVASAGGNISRAARQLGVARNTIYRKLRAHATAADAPNRF